MRFSTAFQGLVSTVLLASSAVALPQITRAGRYLYSADGTRFYIKGIAYQEQGTVVEDPNAPFSEPSTFFDPLSDGNACARDVPVLQRLGVNAIRVYSVNASLNHDSCMAALNSAGIYTIIDLTLPLNGSIDRTAPSWSANLQDSYIRTINAFKNYENVLAYNVGNEVVTSPNETSIAPFIKAAARDTKAYLRSQNLNILVGYAAIDGSRDWVNPLASFLSCDQDSTSIDLFGLNNYEWCGDDSFEVAYAGVQSAFAGYNVPAYFSEFGCITSPPRLWTEVAALFSTQMSDVWSGGIAFSYFPAQSAQGQFGMVTISTDGSTVTPNADFDRLVTAYSSATGPNTPSQSSAGTTSYPTCPGQNSTFLASTSLPPTPNDTACACVVNSLSCQFTPQTDNTTAILGQLLNFGCSSLGSAGGNCNDIAGDGGAGTYGRMEYCDPASKLSFVMTSFYEATNRNAQSCDFGGNATVNRNAPSDTSGVNSAVSACLAASAPTFTPTTPSNNGGSGSSGGGNGGSGNGGSNGGSNGKNGGVSVKGGAIGSVFVLFITLGAALFTLA